MPVGGTQRSRMRSAGAVGVDGERGQVIFCRGEIDSADGGCVHLIVDVEATSDRWHLEFDGGAGLVDQLAGLSQSLPSELA